MRKRGFALQQVLDFRKEVEKVRQMEFSAARGELERAVEHLRMEERKADELAVECTERQKEGILAVELQLYADFSRKKKADIKAQRKTVASLDSQMAEKRETLLNAAKEKKVLQSFKDKKDNEQKMELAGEERKFLDEIALQNLGRGK